MCIYVCVSSIEICVISDICVMKYTQTQISMYLYTHIQDFLRASLFLFNTYNSKPESTQKGVLSPPPLPMRKILTNSVVAHI